MAPKSSSLKLKDAGQLSYTDHPGEGRPIVLLHGFPMDQTMWDAQVEALNKAGHRVITYDMRGFGLSSDPTQSYSHEEDLNELVTELGINEFHLIGMSFGGEIAILYALSHPERVMRMTLIGSGINGYQGKEGSPFPEWVRMARDGRLDEVKEQILRYGEMGRMREDESRRETYQRIERMVIDWRGYALIGDQRRYPDPPSIERLEEISCPVKVIVGLEDSIDSLEQARELETRIPNVELEVIEQEGHFVNMEKPELVNEIILRTEVDIERKVELGAEANSEGEDLREGGESETGFERRSGIVLR